MCVNQTFLLKFKEKKERKKKVSAWMRIWKWFQNKSSNGRGSKVDNATATEKGLSPALSRLMTLIFGEKPL